MLKSILLAEYGHLRLTEQEYCKKLMDNTLSDEEEERYEKPGPFSLISYLEYLMDPSSWGDHGVLLMISMMWQVTITVLVAESLKVIRIRHNRELDRADFLLVLAGKNHYLGTCELNFYHFSFSFRYRRIKCVAGALPYGVSAWPVSKSARPYF